MTPFPRPDAPLAVLLESLPGQRRRPSSSPSTATSSRRGAARCGWAPSSRPARSSASPRAGCAPRSAGSSPRAGIAGEKLGRRSYYRLTPDAEREFARAAALIYAPADPPPLRAWHLVALPAGPDRDAAARTLTRLRFGFVPPQLALLPDRGQALPALPGAPFLATTDDDLAPLVADAWPLAALAAAMRRFLDGFAPLEGRRFEPAEALGLRLMLVHVFRDIALRDPLLPSALLPRDWPGAQARGLFARLYRALSPGAESAVDARLHGPRRHARHRRGHPPPPAAAPRTVTLARRPAFG